MKNIFCLLFVFQFCNFSAIANEQFHLDNATVFYNDHLGDIHATGMTYQTDQFIYRKEKFLISVENDPDIEVITLNSSSSRIAVTNKLVQIMASISRLLVEGLYLNSDLKTVNIRFDSFVLQKSEQLQLGNASINCAFFEKNLAKDSLIDSCIEESNFEVDYLILNPASTKFLEASLFKDIKVKKFNDIGLTIENGLFNLYMKLKNWIPIKIQVQGFVSFDKTQKILIIELDKLRVGIINYKNLFLKKLLELDSNHLKVVGDKVYIQL